jgi:uncharacterized protein YndB with AHSA1/START domain
VDRDVPRLLGSATGGPGELSGIDRRIGPRIERRIHDPVGKQIREQIRKQLRRQLQQKGETQMAVAQSRPDFTLEVRRTFAAPREKVFAAWTEPSQLEKWMCRDVSTHTVIHHQQDIRTGGRYLMEVRDAAKGEVYWGQGVYLEVTPPEKVRFTWSWTKDRPDGENMQLGSEETEVIVEFVARGPATEIILTHTGFHNDKLRKEHDGGWNGCLDILEGVLQQS